MSTSLKLIVSHQGRLTAKYKAAGVTKIKAALAKLVAADLTRGITTRIIFADDASSLTGTAVAALSAKPTESAWKGSIDKLFAKLKPDYLLLLGGPDVLPLQSLTNPVADDDPDVPSDLPYACDAAFSKDASNFLKPTRVVGRLPDVPGATSPDYLLTVIGHAASHASRKLADFTKNFSLSAAFWKVPSQLTLKAVAGKHTGLHLAPPKGPTWKKSELQAPLHYINCHGAPANPIYYGDIPVAGQEDHAMDPAYLATEVAKHGIPAGTVLAAECCYGAEVYDPSLDGDGLIGIAMTYLEKQAAGCFGSTTTSYGATTSGQDQADFICQFFLQSVLKGASLGRATLEARQAFLKKAVVMHDLNLKTIAQFYLLGDPSLHPVAAAKPAGGKALGVRRTGGSKSVDTSADDRTKRRSALASAAESVAQTLCATTHSAAPLTDALQAMVAQWQAAQGGAVMAVSTAEVAASAVPVGPKGPLRRGGKGLGIAKPATAARRVIIAMSRAGAAPEPAPKALAIRRGGKGKAVAKAAPAKRGPERINVMLAMEGSDGKVEQRELSSR